METDFTIAQIILSVKKMNNLVHFYRDVIGLPILYPNGFTDYSTESWVEFNTGSCKLCLHSGGTMNMGKDAPRFTFTVKNVNETRKKFLEKGVTMTEIRIVGPGNKVCDGRDPEGNTFSFEQFISGNY